MRMSLQAIVVEDSETDAELIERALESEGFDLQMRRVQTARELETALDVQSWDLVISDDSLPQFSGLEALRIVKEKADDLPFIMVSGTIGEDVAVQAIRNGADDYLLKDRLGRLGHAVEQAIEKRRAKARRAEELRESERRFRDMLENVDLIAMTLDTSGRITFCNDYLLRLTGWERAEVVGRDWFHRFVPVGDPVRQVFFDTIRRGSIPAHYENPILTRDGGRRDVQWNNTVLRDPKGSVIGIASIGADVTDQKKNEEAKAALALRNESFVKALGEIVYDHDLVRDRIEWGGNPERLTGWTAQEFGVTQREWAERIHRDDAGHVLAEFAGMEKESFFTSEYRFRRKDGNYVWVLDRGFITRDGSGRPTRVIGIMLDITQRRAAEEQLRSRTALSEALLESSLDGIIVVDDAGKTLLQNRRAIDLWKIPKEIANDADDRKRIEFVMSRTKDPDRFIERIEQLYARPLETSREQIELVDGTILDRTSAPVHDSAGKYYGRVWTFHDITEQKRAEQRIADELNFNRTFLQAAPFGIIAYRASGEIISANEAAARLIGARTEELTATNFRKLESWISSGLLAAADRALNGSPEEEIETQFTTTFGKAVWLAFRFIPFHYAGEQHLLVMFTDIEERKRSEAALRESQQRFQQLAENIGKVFWMTDPQKDRMLYISPAYEKIWGRSTESLYEKPQTWLEAIHPEDRERIRMAALGRQVDGNYDETYRIVRPDGSIRWIQDRAFPIRDESGRVYRIAGLAEDITERRQLEEQFRQAQKMEAIGTLAGGIAHDFNNILGAISGYTELAKMNLSEQPVTRGHLDAVSQAAERATGLVRQILAFSRKQAQERKVIQLRHIVSEALKLLRATIPATITFRSSLPSNTHTVLASCKPMKGRSQSKASEVKARHSGSISRLIRRKQAPSRGLLQRFRKATGKRF